MTDFTFTNRDTTPTCFASQLIAQGYSPDEVLNIMKQNKISFPTIPAVLNELMGARNLTVEIIAGCSGINPSTIYKYLNREKNPSRNTLIRIALAMEITLEETQVLLKSGNRAALSGSRVRDVYIMDGIITKKDYEQVNAVLTKNGFSDLNARD